MSDLRNRILGHYRLLHCLGQGGFADVYLGEHIHLKTYASIKLLRSQVAEDGMKHFLAEARTLAALKHPNIVPVFDFGVEEITPYLVMHYAPNGTLRQRHPRGTPVGLNVVTSYVQQVAAALQYAHNQKWIHRDVKPENMLIGDQNQILLSDFGIAMLSASARVTPDLNTSWMSAGTVSYMAPEQIQGRPVVASDQYALAVVIYEWLTGELPFRGTYTEILTQQMSASPPPLRQKAPQISEEVEQVILTALQKDPQRRFVHIGAFARALKLAAEVIEEPVVQQVSTDSAEASNIETALIGPFGRVLLGSITVTIGRSSDNTIVLDDVNVSPHHAEVRQEGPGYCLVDLESTNGTFVDEQPIVRLRVLQPGDQIRIGQTAMLFEVRHASLSTAGVPHTPLLGQIPSPREESAHLTSLTVMQQPTVTPSALETLVHTPPVSTPVGTSHPFPQSPGSDSPSSTAGISQPATKRFPLWRTLLLSMLALLIIVLGAGGTVAYRTQVSLNNTHATATAQAHQQQLAQQASATAQVISPYVPFTRLAFIDPLTSPGTAWAEGVGCHFSSTGLQISVASPQLNQDCFRRGTLGEMAYQVTMTITQGDCGGLLFRFVDANNYAFFFVCSDGMYDVAYVVDGQVHPLFSKERPNPAIHQGLNQQNVLAMTIQADKLNVYINKQAVTVMQQAAFTGTLSLGRIGLTELAFTSATSVSYTNAIVWTQ